MNWEKLRSSTRATFKNLNFESFSELGRSSKSSFIYDVRKDSLSLHPQPSNISLTPVPKLSLPKFEEQILEIYKQG